MPVPPDSETSSRCPPEPTGVHGRRRGRRLRRAVAVLVAIALDRDRPVDVHAGQRSLGSGDVNERPRATLDEQTQQGVQAARPSVSAERHATIAAERASLGSALSIRPRSNRRTRRQLRLHIHDMSPMGTTCWAGNPPIPVAPSTTQRSGSTPRRPRDRYRSASEPHLDSTWPYGRFDRKPIHGDRTFIRHTRPDLQRYGTPRRRCLTSSARAVWRATIRRQDETTKRQSGVTGTRRRGDADVAGPVSACLLPGEPSRAGVGSPARLLDAPSRPCRPAAWR